MSAKAALQRVHTLVAALARVGLELAVSCTVGQAGVRRLRSCETVVVTVDPTTIGSYRAKEFVTPLPRAEVVSGQ